MSQTEIILNVLKSNRRWTPSYNLIRVTTRWGWLGTSGDRRCRELRNEGFLDSKLVNEEGHCIAYFRIKKKA